MKRIIALLLAIMMLPIFTVVSQAAGPMSKQDFKDVLLGNGSIPSTMRPANLIRAYRNISQDQLDVLKGYHTAVETSVVNGIVSPYTSVISNDEAKVLVYGFVKLMTFTNAKDGAISINDIGDSDINRAVDVFCDNITIDSAATSPNAVLNTIAGGNMNKDALGGLIYNMQTNLRQQAEAAPAAFLTTFQAPAAVFKTNVKEYVQNALAAALTAATATNAENLYVAKEAMKTNGFITETAGAVDVTSPFIQLILSSFDVMNADTAKKGDVALSVVFNTILSGVIDTAVNVYSTATATTPSQSIEPNQTVDSISVNDVCYLDIVTGYTLGAGLETAITLPVTNNLEGDATNNVIEIEQLEAGRLKIVGKTAGTGIIKLYRNVNSVFDNQMCNTTVAEETALPELFMELNITVVPRIPTGGGGAISRVEAPTITFEVDGDKNITVTLETATNGATIYYTTDGTAPTKKSQKYEGPFQVEDGTTIKAFAVKNGYIDSYVTTDKIDLQGGLTPTLTGEHIAYVHGRDTGNFDADDNVTRGEVSAMFSRLLVKKMVFKDDSVSQFTDVVEGAWHTPYIKYLSNVKIINGYEDGTFKPDAPITRAEFATIASRFFELEKGAENTFADVTDSHWAKEYIDSAVIKGWLKGYEDGTFKPDQAIKRSEAVTIVNRMLNRAADKAYIEANYEKVLDYPDIDESHWAYYEILEASNWHDHKVENNQESWTDIFYQERFNAS